MKILLKIFEERCSTWINLEHSFKYIANSCFNVSFFIKWNAFKYVSHNLQGCFKAFLASDGFCEPIHVCSGQKHCCGRSISKEIFEAEMIIRSKTANSPAYILQNYNQFKSFLQRHFIGPDGTCQEDLQEWRSYCKFGKFCASLIFAFFVFSLWRKSKIHND